MGAKLFSNINKKGATSRCVPAVGQGFGEVVPELTSTKLINTFLPEYTAFQSPFKEQQQQQQWGCHAQRRATKLVKGLKGMSCEEQLRNLAMASLEKGMLTHDLISFYNFPSRHHCTEVLAGVFLPCTVKPEMEGQRGIHFSDEPHDECTLVTFWRIGSLLQECTRTSRLHQDIEAVLWVNSPSREHTAQVYLITMVSLLLINTLVQTASSQTAEQGCQWPAKRDKNSA
ncbi:hypothetical protein WISP_134954 [Willisornis vidua]|uniref:Uncharacterized protein n=1 Tax=Willisornis vidua TaxID=1566151 RepID=A0ABQ9CNL0_9PASS|nr:hypothetical protein WISP_134954 [Willisornis vidua]